MTERTSQSWEAWKGIEDTRPAPVRGANMRAVGVTFGSLACLADGITPGSASAVSSQDDSSLSRGGNITPSGPACAKPRPPRKVHVAFLGIPPSAH